MIVRLPSLIDKKIGSWVENIPESSRPFLGWVSTVTHPVVWACVLLGGSLVYFGIGNTLWGVWCVVVAALLPLEQILKVIFRRPRPLTMYVDAMKFRSYSFPSGHAYASVLCFGLLIAIMQSAGSAVVGSFFGVAAIGMILLIGVSRVYLGAHFPTDVIAGWIVGAIVLVCLSVYAIDGNIIATLL